MNDRIFHEIFSTGASNGSDRGKRAGVAAWVVPSYGTELKIRDTGIPPKWFC